MRTCSTHWAKENTYRDLVGKPEVKRPQHLNVAGRIILKWISEKEDDVV
jgi:hypothetical protein